MGVWSLDLGTSNSSLAYWDDSEQDPKMIHLPKISLDDALDKNINTRFCIPSSLWLIREKSFWDSLLGRFSSMDQRFYLGPRALICREARSSDVFEDIPNQVPMFKPFLMQDSLRILAKMDGASYSAKSIARLYLRELFQKAKLKTGKRIRHLVIGTPVNSFEPYRAELKAIVMSLGVKTVQFLDEPVAAALGYGLSELHPRKVLVIDFGGGTLDLALISLNETNAESGQCHLIVKDGVSLGGNHVDSWILEIFCREHGFELERQSTHPQSNWWYRLMLEEARRVKESLYFEPTSRFLIKPPANMRNMTMTNSLRGFDVKEPISFSRGELVALLHKNGLYGELENLLDRVLNQALKRGISEGQIDEILMVGGSTLLPEVYSRVEARFGRGKVRAWQPFYAVAYGGAVFGSKKRTSSDYIIHDYAIKTFSKVKHEPEYHIVIPKGTTIPSYDLWKKKLVPTCALGEPEQIFKLIICEMGRNMVFEQEFLWDGQGQLHQVSSNSNNQLIVPLNEDDPTLGFLEPPHQPSEKAPRIEIRFGVNEDRWLIATVLDLKTRKRLLENEPVVRIK